MLHPLPHPVAPPTAPPSCSTLCPTQLITTGPPQYLPCSVVWMHGRYGSAMGIPTEERGHHRWYQVSHSCKSWATTCRACKRLMETHLLLLGKLWVVMSRGWGDNTIHTQLWCITQCGELPEPSSPHDRLGRGSSPQCLISWAKQ